MGFIGGGLVAKSRSTLVTPWTVAHQVPLPMGFSRQEYWSGLPFSILINPLNLLLATLPRGRGVLASSSSLEYSYLLPRACILSGFSHI